MELDLDALQELPCEQEQAGVCRVTCGSPSCPATCPVTGF
jgi:hypothetical protein